MKETLLLVLTLVMSTIGFSQTKIQFRSTDKAECVKSDYSSLKASFSFSGVEAYDVQNERGLFSSISMPNTVIGGNEGDPQIPVINELIAIPIGAKPSIKVTNYNSTDYRLADYGINKVSPRQPDLRKDQKPEEVPFVYNEKAYQAQGLRSEPKAMVSIDGTLRGVQIGRMSIEPVSYDPVNNTLRVFNDIEVEVNFEGADAYATEAQLIKAYSPYFNGIYQQLFNGRAILDIYDQHPDLYSTPVKMLVIANRMFEDCIQEWVAWKTLKGFYMDVNYTDDIGTTASAIKSFIQNKYATDAPTFVMIMGDKDQVPASATGSETNCVTDLYYMSPDGDEFADIFHSRFPAETVAQMTAMLNKAMEYEKYNMPDPSYLNNVLLIAGEDSGWGVTVGRPTIWYATNYYYNTNHGFANVNEFSQGTYTNCYSYLNTGVGFVNYTAHGSNTSWAGPSFTVSDVNSLTNEHKYFLAMGNCCQAADWGISGTCFGEAMVRAENKAAYAYIGSCPSTYWLNDYYFGVGATSRADGTMPSYEETTMGAYDAIWNDGAYNTVCAIPFTGHLAGNQAEALGYTLHISTLYCWQAYHVLGDGSIMPYRVEPTANNVSHMAIFPIGMTTYEVNAVPGSYVAISKDGVLLGTALVGETGSVNVPIQPVTTNGEVTICVTAPQRIPYITTVPAAALEGPYISLDSYTPNVAHVGDNTNLSLTFKNVGTDATTGNTTVTLTTDDSNVTILTNTKTFGTLAANATTTVSGFSFKIAQGVADGTKITLHYNAVNGSDTYTGNIVITANEAVLAYQGMEWDGSFVPGETLTVTAKFKNTGHYQATNATASVSSSSSYVTLSNPTVTVGNIAVDQVVSCQFTITIANNCPETAQLPVTFTLTANQGLSAQGNETLKNSCNLVFNLIDSYGDGWNGNSLNVSFDDGTPQQSLTFSTGNSATFTLEIGNGVHVTLSWTAGSYANECSFNVQYEDGLTIYQSNGTPSAGVICEFDCNCAAASATFNVTASSSNTAQGSVSGGGEFSYGQSCTVTAIPAEGFMFTNWTQDGTVVSSAASFTFNVYSDMNLVAHFEEGNQIGSGTATNNYLPSYNYYKYSLTQQIYTSQEIGAAGTLTGIAFYNAGAVKTRTYDFYMKATTKSTFSSNTDWVSVSASDKVFSGSVTMAANDWTFITLSTPFEYDGNSNVLLVADDNTGAYTNSPHMACLVFEAASQALYIYSDGTNYDPSSPPTSAEYYNAVLSVKNQIQFTKESTTPVVTYTINATAFPTNGGTVTGAGIYHEGATATLNAYPAENYVFEAWEENGAVISTQASISFTVEGNRTLVARFSAVIQQTQTFSIGWGWVSFYINLHGLDGLHQLEQAFGENGILIKSKDAFVQYANGVWNGDLNSIEVEKMYQIKANGNGYLPLTETAINPADHPITIQNGWNWIGYPSSVETDVATAFSTYDGHNDDILKSHNAMTTFIEGYGWWGSLNKMTPGIGYMYKSCADHNTTLVYQNSAKNSQMHTAEAASHWTVNAADFLNNANVIATFDANAIPISEQTEIGAFANGECRGAAKLLYVEPLNQYIAFLTVFGNNDETLTFMAYDNGKTYPLEEQVGYTDNMVVGNVNQPLVFHTAKANGMMLFPNPADAGSQVRLQLPKDTDNATVEIIDMMGRVLYRQVTDGIVITPETPGVYTIRVTDNQGNTHFEKLTVK